MACPDPSHGSWSLEGTFASLIMNAQQILTTMQALTTLDVLQTKVKESEDMVQTLIQEVDRLNKVNRRHQESLDTLFKQPRCPSCTQYLNSKRDGDTIEGCKCGNVFLTRCLGILQ